MSIYQVTKNRIFTNYKLNDTLTPGQIIRGKILKLFPQNKAQIQLGNQILIAQLKAPLSVGESYHFQVQSTDKVIHLAVLGEMQKNQFDQNVKNLLQQLGVVENKSTVQFLQKVIDLGIPITKNDLLTAQKWLESINQKEKGIQVIIDMLTNKLPLKTSIFDALYMRNTSNFTAQINQMINVLNEQKTGMQTNQPLLNSLSKISLSSNHDSLTSNQMVLSSLISHHEQLFHSFKESGIISQQTTFLSWKKAWDHYFTSNHSNISSPQSFMSSSMLQINENEATNIMNHAIKVKANEILSHVEPFLIQVQKNNASLTNSQFEPLKQAVLLELMPFLTDHKQREVISFIKNDGASLQSLYKVLKQMANMTLTGHVNSQIINQLTSIAPQHMFLNHLHTVLSETGLADEYMFMHHNESKETIKSLLIQLIQQGNTNTNQAQQLLHFINGMQLQSVYESANFLQTSIQLPGENLGLQNDIFIDMESKKKESGKIDPDFCRILFYLDLARLKETMIDMHIQKRFVTITIFNNDPHIINTYLPWQSVLKKGLERLNYQLTTVTVKPLQEEKQHRQPQSFNYNQSLFEGIDYRI